MAYQIAFDMYESATQHFLSWVLAAVQRTTPIPIAEKVEKATALAAHRQNYIANYTKISRKFDRKSCKRPNNLQWNIIK